MNSKTTRLSFPLIALAMALLVFACSHSKPITPLDGGGGGSSILEGQADPAQDLLLSQLEENEFIGKRLEIGDTTVVAINRKWAAGEKSPYLTLDEAMEKKLVSVREVEGGGSVNTLILSNEADRPVFLMVGDLMLGGQQDRIIAETLIVDAGQKDVSIPVFCVEHGRWSVQTKDAGMVSEGQFLNKTETGQVALNVKQAAIAGSGNNGDQDMVWQSVSTNNSNLGVEASSGTFRATFDAKEVNEKITSNLEALKAIMTQDTIGFAVLSKGELVAFDAFDSADLCKRLSPKLLRSYAVTAVAGGYEKNDVVSGSMTATITTSLGSGPPSETRTGFFFQDVSSNSSNLGGAENAGTLGVPAAQTNAGTNTLQIENEDGTIRTIDVSFESLGNYSTMTSSFGNTAILQFNSTATTTTSSAPVETTIARTTTRRESVEKGVEYKASDTKSGKVVHRNFMRK